MSFFDRIPSLLLKVVDALLLRNPERTGAGVMLGLAVHGIITTLQPQFAQRGITLGLIDWWSCIGIGVAIVHLPFIVWSVRTRPLISDELESLIALVESTNIGEMEKRVVYRRIVNKCVDEFSLNSAPGTVRTVLKSEIESPSELIEDE